MSAEEPVKRGAFVHIPYSRLQRLKLWWFNLVEAVVTPPPISYCLTEWFGPDDPRYEKAMLAQTIYRGPRWDWTADGWVEFKDSPEDPNI